MRNAPLSLRGPAALAAPLLAAGCAGDQLVYSEDFDAYAQGSAPDALSPGAPPGDRTTAISAFVRPWPDDASDQGLSLAAENDPLVLSEPRDGRLGFGYVATFALHVEERLDDPLHVRLETDGAEAADLRFFQDAVFAESRPGETRLAGVGVRAGETALVQLRLDTNASEYDARVANIDAGTSGSVSGVDTPRRLTPGAIVTTVELEIGAAGAAPGGVAHIDDLVVVKD